MRDTLNLATPNVAEIQLHIRCLRSTILLERQKVAAITVSVKKHEQALSKLEAQLALAGGMPQPARVLIGR